MRKRVFGRQFNRDTNERKALFKSLMSSLVLQERIKTTEEKAKAIKSKLEKLVTKAKKKGQQAEMLLAPYLSSDAVKKMISDIAPRFARRPGGYTRVIKTGNRFSDNARMAVIEWVEQKQELGIMNSTDAKAMVDKQESRENVQKRSKETEIQEAEIVTEKSTKKQTAKKVSTATKKKTTTKETKKKKVNKKSI